MSRDYGYADSGDSSSGEGSNNKKAFFCVEGWKSANPCLPHTASIFKTLLCQNLLIDASLGSEAAIDHLSRAAMLAENLNVPEESLADFDFELLKIIYALNKTFQNVTFINNQNAKVAKLSFGLDYTEENYEEYIAPWVVPAGYYDSLIEEHRVPAYKIVHDDGNGKCGYVFAVVSKADRDATGNDILRDFTECPSYGKKLRNSFPFNTDINLDSRQTYLVKRELVWSFFFEMIHCLSEDGFKKLRTAFQNCAMKICMDAVAQISQLVSSDTYETAISLLNSRPKEEVDEGLLTQGQWKTKFQPT